MSKAAHKANSAPLNIDKDWLKYNPVEWSTCLGYLHQ
jgi:hypothetical protein